VSKTWKSVTKEEAEQEVARREISVKTKKGTMFLSAEYVQQN
jgi:hypothetical protein